MDLSTIENDELLNTLESLRGKERRVILALLYHLLELDKRKLYRETGYSSLFDYCHRKLGYSEGSAHRRSLAARALKLNPELGELLLKRQVTLSSIAAAAKGLEANITSPAELAGKSKREVEVMVAKEAPVRRETIKPFKPAAPEAPLFTEASKSPEPERYEIRFSVTREVYEQFEQVKARLSNSIGALTVEAVLSKLLSNYLNPKTRAGRASNPTSRYIARSDKREILQRDRGTCTYISPDGTRCCETRYLQFDHIKPYALGGRSEPSNLRLLCPAHNRLQAERTFGKASSARR